MADKKTRGDRRAQQTAEVKASQADLRISIAETERLVGESDQMLQRHRQECDADQVRREEALRKPRAPRPATGS